MRSILIRVMMGLAFLSQIIQISMASFQQNQRRYLSPYDFFSLLRQKFPSEVDQNLDNCLTITTKNVNLIGAITPFTGVAFTYTPNPPFVNWYGNCLISLIDHHFSFMQNQLNQKQVIQYFYGKKFFSYWEEEKGNIDLAKVSWSKLPKSLQLEIISHWSQKLLGPSKVIEDLSNQRGEEVFYSTILDSMAKAKTQSKLREATQHIIFLIAMRDEFLRY